MPVRRVRNTRRAVTRLHLNKVGALPCSAAAIGAQLAGSTQEYEMSKVDRSHRSLTAKTTTRRTLKVNSDTTDVPKVALLDEGPFPWDEQARPSGSEQAQNADFTVEVCADTLLLRVSSQCSAPLKEGSLKCLDMPLTAEREDSRNSGICDVLHGYYKSSADRASSHVCNQGVCRGSRLSQGGVAGQITLPGDESCQELLCSCSSMQC